MRAPKIGTAAEDARDADAAQAPSERSLVGWQRAVYWLGLTSAVVLVLAAYGFLPGMSEVPLRSTYSTGMLTCLHDQGLSSLWKWCMATGYPVGAPALTGWVQLHLGWLLTFIPGVSPWTANHLTSMVVVSAGFAGTVLILRRWSTPRWLAILASLSYLLGPNLLQLNGFAYTIDGYLLLPAYVYAGLRVLDLMRSRRWPAATAGALAVGFVMTFTDGYSFFGGATMLACLVAIWAFHAWRRGELPQGLLACAVGLAGVGVPTVVYTVWLPGGAYESAPVLKTFALYGVDIATLFVPTYRDLYPHLLGLQARGLPVWGIDATPPTNYLGYLMAVLAVVGVWLVGRNRWKLRGEVIAVAIALAVTLVLALGPTLKVAQYDAGVRHSLLTLPTSWLYMHLPGLTSMRATNRWLIVTRFCLVLLFAVGITALWHKWRGRSRLRTAGLVVLALLSVAEVLPDAHGIVIERQESAEHVRFLSQGVVAEAKQMLHRNELILVLPSANDFLADYLVPTVGVRSYNVGIDKNYALAVGSWPQSVLAARNAYGQPGFADAVCTVLAHDADAVVLTAMDTHNGPLLFGNSPANQQTRRTYDRSIARDKRFDAQTGEWLTVLQASPAGPCARSS